MKKVLLLLILLNFFMCSYAQWVHINPGTTDFMGDIDFVTEQIGYVEDWDNGMLWATSNGGASWTQLFNTPYLGYINFLTPDTGYGCSIYGLYRTIDGGHFWNPVIVDSSIIWWSRPYFFNLGIGITVQSGGLFPDSIYTYKTLDSGSTWNIISSFRDSIGIQVNDLFFADTSVGYMMTFGRIYKTMNGGINWNIILADDNDDFVSCYFVSPDTGFIGSTYSHKIFRTTNGGLSWQTPILPVSTPIYSIKFLTHELGYACGGDGFSSGFIIKTSDGGITWTLDYGDNFTYVALSFPGNNIGFACGMGGSAVKNISITNNENLISGNNLFLSPNPTTGQLNIGNMQSAIEKIEIYNLPGKQVGSWHPEVSGANSNNEITIDLTKLSPGIYFLQASDGESVWRGKVIKE